MTNSEVPLKPGRKGHRVVWAVLVALAIALAIFLAVSPVMVDRHWVHESVVCGSAFSPREGDIAQAANGSGWPYFVSETLQSEFLFEQRQEAVCEDALSVRTQYVVLVVGPIAFLAMALFLRAGRRWITSTRLVCLLSSACLLALALWDGPRLPLIIGGLVQGAFGFAAGRRPENAEEIGRNGGRKYAPE